MTGYAGFWLRLVAYIIDWVVVEVLVFVVTFGIGSVAAQAGSGGAIGAVAAVAGLVIGLLYWAGLESSARQATLGKMAVGIRVTDLAGNRLSFGRALVRTLAKLLSALIFMIGYLMVAFTARKQGLHDLIAGTLVVKQGSAPPTPGTGHGGAEPRLSGMAPTHPTPR